MKNQYFGDVNDYRKYGLLRILQRTAGLRIGVGWCLTADDGGKHGEVRRYLESAGKWRRYDPALFDILQRLNAPTTSRSVALAREWGIVPQAEYFEGLLGTSAESRSQYFRELRRVTANCELIFLDPDNGIEVSGTRPGRAGAQKYVFWRELRELYAQGRSILVYQHFPRVLRQRFIPSLAIRLAEELGCGSVIAFATPRVLFLLAAQAEHAETLIGACDEVGRQWPGQITPWPPFLDESIQGPKGAKAGISLQRNDRQSIVTLRRALAAGAEQIARLVTERGYPTGGDQMRRRLRTILNNDEYATCVACDQNEIVGFVGHTDRIAL